MGSMRPTSSDVRAALPQHECGGPIAQQPWATRCHPQRSHGTGGRTPAAQATASAVQCMRRAESLHHAGRRWDLPPSPRTSHRWCELGLGAQRVQGSS
eukprot:6540470-Pyramimonas_sp.AAC.1